MARKKKVQAESSKKAPVRSIDRWAPVLTKDVLQRQFPDIAVSRHSIKEIPPAHPKRPDPRIEDAAIAATARVKQNPLGPQEYDEFKVATMTGDEPTVRNFYVRLRRRIRDYFRANSISGHDVTIRARNGERSICIVGRSSVS